MEAEWNWTVVQYVGGICVCMCAQGVTQELIDETRSSTENQMLADLQKLAGEGGSLQSRGGCGETVVCGFAFSECHML